MVPALCVAERLRDGGDEVVFVGGERAEATLVPEAGFALRSLGAVHGLDRTSRRRAAAGALKAVGALRTSRKILRDVRPDAVLGGGGYVAGPVGAAAVAARIPLVLTEADSHLGLTNRLLAPFSRRVCLAFALEGRDGERYRVTGRPVPPAVEDRAAARARFAIPPDVRCVVVFGGSLGALTINEAAIEGLAGAPFHVLHASGTRDHGDLLARVPSDGRYHLEPYVTPFGDALAAADLAVARSGGSIFEVCAHGLPAVLVPYPHAAADHQRTNAAWMRDGGAAVVVDDAELSASRLRREVDALLGDPARLEAMAAASLALARPRAAGDVADELRAAAGAA